MVKKEYPCEVCGKIYSSRGARSYHVRTVHRDPVDAIAPDAAAPAAQAPAGDPPAPVTAAPPETTKEEKVGSEILTSNIKDQGGIMDGDDPDLMRDEPLADPDEIPYILLIPLFIVAGAVILFLLFRDRVIELWRGKKGKPPGNTAPSYCGGAI